MAVGRTLVEILSFLDATSRAGDFPIVDDIYVAPVDQRASGLRSGEEWAIVLELFGFNTRVGGEGGCVTAVYHWRGGSDAQSTFGVDYRRGGVSTAPGEPLFEEDSLELVHPDCGAFSLGSTIVRLGEKAALRGAFSSRLAPSRLHIVDLLRAVAANHSRELFLTPEELVGRYCPRGALRFMVSNWRHPAIRRDVVASLDIEAIVAPMIRSGVFVPIPDVYEKPSESDFTEFARAVSWDSDDAEMELSDVPNARWHHWPGAGTY